MPTESVRGSDPVQPLAASAAHEGSARTLGIEAWVLDVLACPACRASLQVDEPASTLVCTECARAYPVRDGIPVLLVDEAIENAGGSTS